MTVRMAEPGTERLGLKMQIGGMSCALDKLECENRHLLNLGIWTIFLHLWTALPCLYESFWMEEFVNIGWGAWIRKLGIDHHLFLELWNRLNKTQSALRWRAPWDSTFFIFSLNTGSNSGSLTIVIRTFEGIKTELLWIKPRGLRPLSPNWPAKVVRNRQQPGHDPYAGPQSRPAPIREFLRWPPSWDWDLLWGCSAEFWLWTWKLCPWTVEGSPLVYQEDCCGLSVSLSLCWGTSHFYCISLLCTLDLGR